MSISDSGLVPFNRPYASDGAFRSVLSALGSEKHSGDGPWTAKVSQELEGFVNGSRVLLTPSGTDALELACMTVGVEPGDEIIVPSFTFSSVATAPLRQGASLRFSDVEPDTLGLSVRTVEPLLSDRTKAIVAVHYAGQASELEHLRSLCARRSIFLIEDAAHALGAALDGRPLGTFGHLGCLSFHETKNLSCGEGGALIINDPNLIQKAEIIREKGTNRSSFFRGMVDKYTWVSPGSSFLLSDLLAAVLMANLEDWHETQATRRHAWQRYQSELAPFCERHGFRTPPTLKLHQNPWHMFYLLAPNEGKRDSLLEHCKKNDVLAVFHYQSLSQTPYGQALDGQKSPTPISDSTADRLLRLPLFSSITTVEIDKVIATLNSWDGAPITEL